MPEPVTGTFSDTGSSAQIIADFLAMDLGFAGVASVNIERKIDGVNWRLAETHTESISLNVETKGFPIRLTCTEHTDDVAYSMIPVQGTVRNF